MLHHRQDFTNQPQVAQRYSVPIPEDDQYFHHDQAVYSIWMHFVTYCLETDRSNNDSFKSNEIRAHAHPDYLNPPSASKFADATYGRIKPCENSLFFEETIPVNPFTNSDRLSVFKNLSAGNPVEATLNTKRKIDSVPLMSGIKVRGKSPILKLCLPCPTPKPFRNIPRDTSGHIATVYPFHVKDTYQLNHDIYNNNDDDNNNTNTIYDDN